MKTKTLKTKTRTPKASNRLRSAGLLDEPNGRMAPAPGGMKLKVILVPIDFSAESKKALRYASKLAEQFGAVLRLVHVVEPAPFLNDMPNVVLVRDDQEIAKQSLVKLQSLAQAEIDELIPVYPEVRVGKPYHEIVAAASVQNADLIVIPTHGYTGLKHAFLGSTAERVVRHAQCPVLVVRQHEHDLVN